MLEHWSVLGEAITVLYHHCSVTQGKLYILKKLIYPQVSEKFKICCESIFNVIRALHHNFKKKILKKKS